MHQRRRLRRLWLRVMPSRGSCCASCFPRASGPCRARVAPEAARAAVASATVTSFVKRIPYLRGLVAACVTCRLEHGRPAAKSLERGRSSYSRFTQLRRDWHPGACLSQQPSLGQSPFEDSPFPSPRRRRLFVDTRYFNSTVAPASSSWPLIVSASSLATPSLTGLGAPSTKSLASFSPRPVTARTTLITWIFWPPASLRTTSKEVFSSAAAAPSPPPPAGATATGAAAVMPHSSSILFFSSTSSSTDIFPSSSKTLSTAI